MTQGSLFSDFTPSPRKRWRHRDEAAHRAESRKRYRDNRDAILEAKRIEYEQNRDVMLAKSRERSSRPDVVAKRKARTKEKRSETIQKNS